MTASSRRTVTYRASLPFSLIDLSLNSFLFPSISWSLAAWCCCPSPRNFDVVLSSFAIDYCAHLPKLTVTLLSLRSMTYLRHPALINTKSPFFISINNSGCRGFYRFQLSESLAALPDLNGFIPDFRDLFQERVFARLLIFSICNLGILSKQFQLLSCLPGPLFFCLGFPYFPDCIFNFPVRI
jgi:hypothetical protein